MAATDAGNRRPQIIAMTVLPQAQDTNSAGQDHNDARWAMLPWAKSGPTATSPPIKTVAKILWPMFLSLIVPLSWT